MSAACDDLVAFADSELAADRADAFRDHLDDCEACRARLLEALQLSARLGALSATAPPPDRRASTSARSEDLVLPPSVIAPPRRSSRPWPIAAIAVGGAAVATLALWPAPAGRVATLDAPVDRVVLATIDTVVHEHVFGAATSRPYPIRLALRGADRYRDEGEGVRRARDPSQAPQVAFRLPGDLPALDAHTLAIAQVWNHGSIPDAAQLLSELPPTPALTNDLAALQSLGTLEDELDPYLAELDRLRASPDLAAARAARWNYALLLSRLELPLSAAEAFRAIAAEGEPGWSDEARARAEQQQARPRTRVAESASASGVSLSAAAGGSLSAARERAYAHEARLRAQAASAPR